MGDENWLHGIQTQLIETPEWLDLVNLIQKRDAEGGGGGVEEILDTAAYRAFVKTASAVVESSLASRRRGTIGAGVGSIDSLSGIISAVLGQASSASVAVHQANRLRSGLLGRSLDGTTRRSLWKSLLAPPYLPETDGKGNRIKYVDNHDSSSAVNASEFSAIVRRSFRDWFGEHVATDEEVSNVSHALAQLMSDNGGEARSRTVLLSTVGCGLVVGLGADKPLDRDLVTDLLRGTWNSLKIAGVTVEEQDEMLKASLGTLLKECDVDLHEGLMALGMRDKKTASDVVFELTAGLREGWFFGSMPLDTALFCFDQCAISGFYRAGPALLVAFLASAGLRNKLVACRNMPAALMISKEYCRQKNLTLDVFKGAATVVLESLKGDARRALGKTFSDAYVSARDGVVSVSEELALEYLLPPPTVSALQSDDSGRGEGVGEGSSEGEGETGTGRYSGICSRFRAKARHVWFWLLLFRGIREKAAFRRSHFLNTCSHAIKIKPFKTMNAAGVKTLLRIPPVCPNDSLGVVVAMVMALEAVQGVFGDDDELEMEFAEALTVKIRTKIPSLEDDTDSQGIRSVVATGNKTRRLYFRAIPDGADPTAYVVRSLYHAGLVDQAVDNDVVASLCKDVWLFSQAFLRNVESSEVKIPPRMQFGLPILPDRPVCAAAKRNEPCVFGSLCSFNHDYDTVKEARESAEAEAGESSEDTTPVQSPTDTGPSFPPPSAASPPPPSAASPPPPSDVVPPRPSAVSPPPPSDAVPPRPSAASPPPPSDAVPPPPADTSPSPPPTSAVPPPPAGDDSIESPPPPSMGIPPRPNATPATGPVVPITGISLSKPMQNLMSVFDILASSTSALFVGTPGDNINGVKQAAEVRRLLRRDHMKTAYEVVLRKDLDEDEFEEYYSRHFETDSKIVKNVEKELAAMYADMTKEHLKKHGIK